MADLARIPGVVFGTLGIGSPSSAWVQGLVSAKPPESLIPADSGLRLLVIPNMENPSDRDSCTASPPSVRVRMLEPLDPVGVGSTGTGWAEGTVPEKRETPIPFA